MELSGALWNPAFATEGLLKVVEIRRRLLDRSRATVGFWCQKSVVTASAARTKPDAGRLLLHVGG